MDEFRKHTEDAACSSIFQIVAFSINLSCLWRFLVWLEPLFLDQLITLACFQQAFERQSQTDLRPCNEKFEVKI